MMERLKLEVAEEKRQNTSFKKDHKKMHTTVKKAKCSILWILFIFICGLQFVFANALTANAETSLTVSADGAIDPSTALTLHPYSYKQDFENEDPFEIWTSNGTYTVNYKGISSERSANGKKSFKIDINFDTATYVYWKIPVNIPSAGELNFKGDIYVSTITGGASASLGTNFSLYPYNGTDTNYISKLTERSKSWVTQKSNLVDTGLAKAKTLTTEHLVDATENDVGIWTDKIVLYMFGKKGSKISLYVDNIEIQGNVPSVSDYSALTEASWNTYQNNLEDKTNLLAEKTGEYKEDDGAQFNKISNNITAIKNIVTQYKQDPSIRTLPLAAHWNNGKYWHTRQPSNGFTPEYQITLLNNGHHILPWFAHFTPPGNFDIQYFKEPLKKLAEWKLPISFIGTQWERLLSQDSYLSLPLNENPNVIDLNGNVLSKVSPFGPSPLWNEVGKKWTSTSLMKKIQDLYPEPPMVLFISNNEHGKLRWTEANQSKRYVDLYGTETTGTFKRKTIGDQWIKLYRELHSGMREGLHLDNWRQNSQFIGYEAMGTPAFGRWHGWMEYSLYTPGRIEPWPAAWDGASTSFYVHNWNPSTDYKVWSPQIQSMNWIFMLKEVSQSNPTFWFEMSTWDGHQPLKDDDKRKYYESLGQTYGPERYAGMVQFGMWLLRPRVVREFRGWTDSLEQAEDYFMAIVQSVDQVHTNQILGKFWTDGDLVPNKKHPHLYQAKIPVEYQDADRWFLLDTELDPKHPWSLSTEIPVFSLALVVGQSPQREWLVYAFSPLSERKDIKVTLPDYGDISIIKASPSGEFYHIIEKTEQIFMIN